MTVHHLVNEEELQTNCPYCKQRFGVEEVRKWKSRFYLRKHYKEHTCPTCGKLGKIKVGFEGSGHDSWADEIIRRNRMGNIEDMVNG